MELEKKFDILESYFGKANLKIEYILESDLDILDPRQFSKIQLTYLPTGKIIIAEKFDTQIKNAVDALERLKAEINEYLA